MNWFVGLLLAILRFIIPISLWDKLPFKRVSSSNRSVVITGCDTGFGHETAIRLVLAGHRVFAGCLTADGEESLRRDITLRFNNTPATTRVVSDDIKVVLDRLRPFRLDVTNIEHIKAAASMIEEACPEGVYSVVNNAGIMAGGPIEWTSTDVFRREMNVNYFGAIDVIRTFLPLLRRYGPGARIVVVSSMIGLLPHFPGLAGYASSKHALECFVNTLRCETMLWGIKVINICPGTSKTPFLETADKQMQDAWQSAPTSVRASYGDAYYEWWKRRVALCKWAIADSPTDAYNSLFHAVTAYWPKTRYYTGWDSRYPGRIVPHLPDWLVDWIVGVVLMIGHPQPAAPRGVHADNIVPSLSSSSSASSNAIKHGKVL